jgi:hypothetical protein
MSILNVNTIQPVGSAQTVTVSATDLKIGTTTLSSGGVVTTETIIHHDNHIDYEFSHRGAIFYLNTNNELTVLKDKIEVEAIENRLLLFDASKPHHSTTCSDDKCRVNVNFNFF